MVTKNIFSTSFLGELIRATNNQQVKQVGQYIIFNLLFWS
jgi:hypothetical protein